MKDVGIFLGREEKQRDLGGCEKRTKPGFFWVSLFKVVIFLGIKYELLSDHPVIKICAWGPWAQRLAKFVLCVTYSLLR